MSAQKITAGTGERTAAKPYKNQLLNNNTDSDRLIFLPDIIRNARRWLLWTAGKVPHYANGRRRHGQLDAGEDVAQLVTLDEALDALDDRFAGVGFALGFDAVHGLHWQGLDLDDALEDGAFTTKRARVILDSTEGYAEVSPSGRGLHVIGLGKPFDAIKWKRPGEQAIEAYCTARYFTVTGRMMREGDPVDLAPAVEKIRAALVAAGGVRETRARQHVGDDVSAYLERMPANLQAYVKAHPIEAALQEHGYRAAGSRYMSPASESGIPGVIALDDGLRAVTFHASDSGIGTEVNGGAEVFNAFDLLVRHQYDGDRKRAMRETLPPSLPPGALPRQTLEAAIAGQQRDEFARGPDAPRMLDLRDLAKRTPEPPPHIVPGWLPAGEVTLLAGHGGTGKSAFALRLAVCLASGANFYGLPVEQRGVDFVSFEDRADVLHWRLHLACAVLGVDLASIADRLHVYDGSHSVLLRIPAKVTEGSDERDRRLSSGTA